MIATTDDLDAALVEAHEAADGARLVTLYTEAANQAGDIDSECFFLTHAYVFALQVGHSSAGALHARLIAHGREE